MHSIRTKFTIIVVTVIIITLSIATAIGVISIKKLGSEDADQMLHMTAATGAMNLEQYFESVEHSVRTVSTLVSDSFDGKGNYDLVFGEAMAPLAQAELKELTERLSVPFVIKGVLSLTDAVKCAENGVKGILVSHHHGRLPFSMPPAALLPEIRKEGYD